MSDEPYAFGPTDPRTQAVPIGAPDAQPETDARAWGSVPNTQPAAIPPAGGADPAAPAPWGAQPPVEGRRRMSTMAKSLTAVGVAAVIAVGGTVAVTSANADNTGSAASSPVQPMGGGGYGPTGTTGTDGGTAGSAGSPGTDGAGRSGGFGGGMASRSLLAEALHGDFVVADGTGTVTERLQTGSVTSISSSSITVLSTDKFTATYAVPSGTDVSALATGTTVTVIAKVDGSTATVVSITAAGQGSMSGRYSGGTGTGGTGTGGTGTRASGSDGTGTAPGGTAPGGSTSATTGEDSGV